jgi:peptidoglycan/xylan/chitin deacetylase (PgdA/CDA1 family)
MSGINQLRRIKHWLRRQIKPAGLILLYHRIADVSPDPFHLCVSPDHFAEQLAVLKRHFHPMPLQQFVQAMQQGRLPKRAVALTFDDGYADNLYAAKPLLERYQIPATAFITTDHLTRPREAWWDELEKILLQPGCLPDSLHLTIQDQTYEWDLGNATEYSKADSERDRTWNWYNPAAEDPTTRQSLYRSLYELLHPLPERDRQPILDQLLAWSSLEETPRSTYRFLTPSEVPLLAEGNLIEIGSHTVTHPFLATLSVEAQHQEIEASKQKLEALISQPIRGFAYPHGNYSPETVEIVRQLGFDYAVTTQPCYVRSRTDTLQIPRIVVPNWDGATFTQQIRNWF